MMSVRNNQVNGFIGGAITGKPIEYFMQRSFTDEEVKELTKNYVPQWRNIDLNDLEDEVWVDFIKGEYQGSSFGRIKSLKRIKVQSNGTRQPIRERILVQIKEKRVNAQYLSIKINSKRIMSHTIIATCFHQNPDNKREVNHRNLIKDCNEYWNLEWNTRQDNMDHAKANNVFVPHPGETHGMAILTNKQALLIFKSDLTNVELSEMFGVTRSTIENIKNGKQWSTVTGKKYKRYRLTEERVIEIFNDTGRVTDLAKKYHTSPCTVSEIKNRNRWTEITDKLLIK